MDRKIGGLEFVLSDIIAHITFTLVEQLNRTEYHSRALNSQCIFMGLALVHFQKYWLLRVAKKNNAPISN